MQDGAGQHAEHLGFGFHALETFGLFFALVRVHVVWNRIPMSGETLRYATWTGEANRFFCPRFHTFSLEDGTPVASASTLWVLMDTQSRQVVNPLKTGLVFPDTSDLSAPVSMPARSPQMKEPARYYEQMPRNSEFDVNQHVNNTKYITWLFDALDEDTFRSAYPTELSCDYVREIRGFEPLTLAFHLADDVFSFKISSADCPKHFVASGKLKREAF